MSKKRRDDEIGRYRGGMNLRVAVLLLLCFAILGCSGLGYQPPPGDPRALVHDEPNGASGGVGGGSGSGGGM